MIFIIIFFIIIFSGHTRKLCSCFQEENTKVFEKRLVRRSKPSSNKEANTKSHVRPAKSQISMCNHAIGLFFDGRSMGRQEHKTSYCGQQRN